MSVTRGARGNIRDNLRPKAAFEYIGIIGKKNHEMHFFFWGKLEVTSLAWFNLTESSKFLFMLPSLSDWWRCIMVGGVGTEIEFGVIMSARFSCVHFEIIHMECFWIPFPPTTIGLDLFPWIDNQSLIKKTLNSKPDWIVIEPVRIK